jgi:DNA polymerase
VRVVRVDGRFEGWRESARALLARGVPPEAVSFTEGEQLGLPSGEPAPAASTAAGSALRVPPRLLALGRRVACHREPSRWDRLYRVLWRVARDGGCVLEDAADEDVLALARMEQAVREDVHRVQGLVRFRRVSADGEAWYVAFHRPAHDTLRLAAPFFARRYAPMRWTILTPGVSAHWDRRALTFGPGVARDPVGADEVEALWRAYYTSTFDPARVNERLLRAHLPRRHWETLPEARELAGLVRAARTLLQLPCDENRDTPRMSTISP